MRFDTTEDIANAMAAARKTAEFIGRGLYEVRVAPWRELIASLQHAYKIRIIDVVFSLLKDLQDVGKLEGTAAMWILAAAHDLLIEQASGLCDVVSVDQAVRALDDRAARGGGASPAPLPPCSTAPLPGGGA